MTRQEKTVANKLDDGDVLVRAVFVAFPAEDAEGRAEAQALIEEAVLRKAWEFWR